MSIHRGLVAPEFLSETRFMKFERNGNWMHFVRKQWNVSHVDFCCDDCVNALKKKELVLTNVCYNNCKLLEKFNWWFSHALLEQTATIAAWMDEWTKFRLNLKFKAAKLTVVLLLQYKIHFGVAISSTLITFCTKVTLKWFLLLLDWIVTFVYW